MFVVDLQKYRVLNFKFDGLSIILKVMNIQLQFNEYMC